MSTLHFFHLFEGNRKALTKTVPKTLDVDSGKCDSLRCELIEKGFRIRFGGLFLCRVCIYRIITGLLLFAFSLTVALLELPVKLVQLP